MYGNSFLEIKGSTLKWLFYYRQLNEYVFQASEQSTSTSVDGAIQVAGVSREEPSQETSSAADADATETNDSDNVSTEVHETVHEGDTDEKTEEKVEEDEDNEEKDIENEKDELSETESIDSRKRPLSPGSVETENKKMKGNCNLY